MVRAAHDLLDDDSTERTWHGIARHGIARHGIARHCTASLGIARHRTENAVRG
jgi:hypothetical protein